jgi:hypothetical protein
LHASRLYGNNSRCLERLRHSDDPRGSLCVRLEEVHSVEDIVTPPARNSVVPKGEYTFESLGPLNLIELSVSLKFVSGGSGTMLRNYLSVIDIIVYLGEELPKKQQGHSAKVIKAFVDKHFCPCVNFLLTLEVV